MHETGRNWLATVGVVLAVGAGSGLTAQTPTGRLTVARSTMVEQSLRNAAESGSPVAQFKLGYDLLYGGEVPRDPAQGIKWLTKAADAGNAMAQYCLAQAWWVGDGVAADPKQAARWMQRAADQGHETAQYDLGLMYLKGDGVPQSEAESRRWIAESQRTWAARQDRKRRSNLPAEDRARLVARAVKGGPAEQYYLAGDLMLGESGPRDYDESLKWFAVAAANGDDDSVQFRNWLQKKLPKARAEESLRQARQLVAARQAPVAPVVAVPVVTNAPAPVAVAVTPPPPAPEPVAEPVPEPAPAPVLVPEKPTAPVVVISNASVAVVVSNPAPVAPPAPPVVAVPEPPAPAVSLVAVSNRIEVVSVAPVPELPTNAPPVAAVPPVVETPPPVVVPAVVTNAVVTNAVAVAPERMRQVAGPDDALTQLFADPKGYVGKSVEVEAAVEPDLAFAAVDPDGDWTSFTLVPHHGISGHGTTGATAPRLNFYHFMNRQGMALYEAVRVGRLAGRAPVYRMTLKVYPGRNDKYPVEILQYEPVPSGGNSAPSRPVAAP
jgi:TPR repeat protein